jgi:hypothetical protein
MIQAAIQWQQAVFFTLEGFSTSDGAFFTPEELLHSGGVKNRHFDRPFMESRGLCLWCIYQFVDLYSR